MKKIIIYCSILIMALLYQSCVNHHGSTTGVYVYTVENPAGLTENNARELIVKFTGDKEAKNLVHADDNTVYYVSATDLNTSFEQDLNTGNFTFNRDMNKYMGDFVPQLPDPGKAGELAASFLQSNGIYPGNKAELKMVHQGGLRSQGTIDGKKGGAVIDKLITLTYGRVLDSFPVIGPGSKIVVNIGDKGDVVGMIHRWREISKGGRKDIQPEEIITIEEATELAKRQIIQQYGANAGFTIEKSFKAYYDNNGKILQPVFGFETTVTLGGKEQQIKPFPYLCVIAMLKKSPEPLNLTAIDGRAKEQIKNIRPEQRDTTTRGRD